MNDKLKKVVVWRIISTIVATIVSYIYLNKRRIILPDNIIKKKITLLNSNDYIKSLLLLMKPRVMSLVIFTCAVGLLTAPNTVSLFDATIGIFFVTIGAGAAGALNMWYEADLDKLMTRTCLRPIPTGKINREHALIFGIIIFYR